MTTLNTNQTTTPVVLWPGWAVVVGGFLVVVVLVVVVLVVVVMYSGRFSPETKQFLLIFTIRVLI